MILQSLNTLYERLVKEPEYEIPPIGFSIQRISFCIVLKEDGTLLEIQDIRQPGNDNKLRSVAMQVLGEGKPSGSGLNPCTLWDNTSYLLGYKIPDKNPATAEKEQKRALESFEASKEFHLSLKDEINDPQFAIVCRFFEKWLPELAQIHSILEELGTGFGIFRIRGTKHPVHESPAILQWWKKKLNKLENDTNQETAPCLITGKSEVVARTHPKIKGVANAQSSGAAVVSFNATSYESYGKTQNYNAPVSQQAAFQYTTALNSLLTGPQAAKHRIRIGDTTTVFWTGQPTEVEDCLADIFFSGSQAIEEAQDEGQRTRIQWLLEAIRAGKLPKERESESKTPFFILGLSPNAARLAIRFFYTSDIADFLHKLSKHQSDLQIIRQFTKKTDKGFPDPEFPSVFQILRGTARTSDEIPPLLGGALMRAIIEGTLYPEGLYSAIIRRIRIDREVNYLKAATLKAVLTRNHQQTIPIMLDTNNTNQAYLLGRLFSALEKTQDDVSNVKSGVRERFYSSASATPAAVFPRLLQNYQHHLSKLEGGLKVNRERLIQGIFAPFSASGFPNHLTLQEQGIFAIGYYHQRQDFFTKKENTSEETPSSTTEETE